MGWNRATKRKALNAFWSSLVNEYRHLCGELAAHADQMLKVMCRAAACPPEVETRVSPVVSAEHFENTTVQRSTSGLSC